MNLLALINIGEVSIEEAERLFNDTIENVHSGAVSSDWRESLGFSEYEATACLQGAGLADLVRLRYGGWPTQCSRCGLTLDYRIYGWWFVHCENGEPCLRHIECPPVPQIHEGSGEK